MARTLSWSHWSRRSLVVLELANRLQVVVAAIGEVLVQLLPRVLGLVVEGDAALEEAREHREEDLKQLDKCAVRDHCTGSSVM